MASAVQKITLSASQDIPFNKLLLSQSNVRRVKAGVSVEELAEDIARRGLLQGLSVRAVINEAGEETGMFEIPAGGRRYRALELLVKQKRLAKTAPVPCIVRVGGVAEEDSLAENVQRAPLHPLDQFRAFLALREKGQSEEEIAATFFVAVAVVKQRLKLASVSSKLLDVYAEDGMTLDQLMAFTVSGDHVRQEQVWERICQSHDKQPYMIRRWLTEGAVRAADKRAQFIGVDAYVEAGGCVLRDLFQGDDGGWLQDIALVDMMTAEKLCEEAAKVEAEGWKWVEAAPDFPYGHSFGLRHLRGDAVPMTPEEEATRNALQAELDKLTAEYEDAPELPEEIDQRLSEIETALEAIELRPLAFEPDDIARAGAFVSIDRNGGLTIERGYVRPEDELPIEPELETADGERALAADYEGGASITADADAEPASEPEEDEGLKPLSDRLVSELTAYRTVALREALSERPDIAYLAVLHALSLRVFYHYAQDSCLELELKSVSFPAQVPGLTDSKPAQQLRYLHETWEAHLPKEPEALWDTLVGWDEESRQALFAFVVAHGVNASVEAYNRRPRAIAHADRIAAAVDLDVAATGWTPTVDTFLGRVTKARILLAVAEAKGQRAADRIEHMKKGEMADQAQELLVGTGWIPEPLRTPGRPVTEASAEVADEAGADAPTVTADDATEPTGEETAADGGEPAMAEHCDLADDGDVAEGHAPFAHAAE
ncbi:ParB/RepB/Spo0J family partition protein [Brevundimonas sp. DS20]|uniref:ParB/RepB/Spo0J family partition protein n=1 Tax=Brevundimonas sp. DS20 TaxID=1532555 RepID=UPI0006D0B3EC|nr:ParB/RepB/Spo0J family partition protein [Brevundimonas sp. DS20]ALJ06920.1 DNA-binding protein [Brevundimonas sp. DS20]